MNTERKKQLEHHDTHHDALLCCLMLAPRLKKRRGKKEKKVRDRAAMRRTSASPRLARTATRQPGSASFDIGMPISGREEFTAICSSDHPNMSYSFHTSL